MDINEVFNLLKYRANKSGFDGFISSSDFNLLFPASEIRYFNKLLGNQNLYQYGNPNTPIAYPETLKISTSLSKFKSAPTTIAIDSAGKYTKPSDFFYVDSLRNINSGQGIDRVEEQDVAGHLSSYYQPPTAEFPIYTEYDTFIQFYPTNLGSATLTYLKKPRTSVWGYTLNGTIATVGTLVGGSGYPNGTWTNIAVSGGSGTGARFTAVVSGGIVTSVTVTNGGTGYKVGDIFTGTIGGGTGASVTVATIKNAREVYNAATSVDPLWSAVDIDEVIYLCLQDISENMRDNDLQQFSQVQSKTGGS